MLSAGRGRDAFGFDGVAWKCPMCHAVEVRPDGMPTQHEVGGLVCLQWQLQNLTNAVESLTDTVDHIVDRMGGL